MNCEQKSFKQKDVFFEIKTYKTYFKKIAHCMYLFSY